MRGKLAFLAVDFQLFFCFGAKVAEFLGSAHKITPTAVQFAYG